MPQIDKGGLGVRIALAIGGRDQATAFEDKTEGRFKRKTVQSWIDGKTAPDLAEIEDFAAAAERRIGWLLGIDPSPPPPPLDLVFVPRLDVEAAAGGGRVVDVVASIADLPFPREFAERMAPRGADLQCLQVRGDSMAPTIQDGALIVIDAKQRELPAWQAPPRKSPKPPQKHDAIYVFNHSGLVRLKRLRDIGDDYVAVLSDNMDAHPPEIIRRGRDGGFKVLGRVVWWDVRG